MERKSFTTKINKYILCTYRYRRFGKTALNVLILLPGRYLWRHGTIIIVYLFQNERHRTARI